MRRYRCNVTDPQDPNLSAVFPRAWSPFQATELAKGMIGPMGWVMATIVDER